MGQKQTKVSELESRRPPVFEYLRGRAKRTGAAINQRGEAETEANPDPN